MLLRMLLSGWLTSGQERGEPKVLHGTGLHPLLLLRLSKLLLRLLVKLSRLLARLLAGLVA